MNGWKQKQFKNNVFVNILKFQRFCIFLQCVSTLSEHNGVAFTVVVLLMSEIKLKFLYANNGPIDVYFLFAERNKVES